MKIGFDLQEVERIENDDGLLHKIALESEIAYIERFKGQKKEKTASLWAVKEAVFKALDVCEGQISFKEIELLHKENGAPYVALHGKAKAVFEGKGLKEIEVSLSHQKSVVGAVVIVN